MLATATFVDFYKTDVNEPKKQNYTRAVGRAKAFEPLLRQLKTELHPSCWPGEGFRAIA